MAVKGYSSAFWRHWALIVLVACAVGLPSLGATFVVDRLDDANGSCEPGDCSLREALLAAEDTPEPDTVIVPPGRHTLSIPPVSPGDPAGGSLAIVHFDVEIIAPAGAIIDAQGIDRVFLFFQSLNSRLVNLTITGGRTLGLGGGIYGEGSNLKLENVWIVANQAYIGGGLAVELGTVKLDRVTISGNECMHGGGGVYLFGISRTRIGRLTVRNSTISGNHADLAGGAIFIGAAGQLLLEYSTVAENTNRSGDETISPFVTRPNSDAIYTLAEGACNSGTDARCIYLSSRGDKLAVDDLGLEPLAMNGGLTPTHALLPESPALDIVPPDAVCPDDDQRGTERPEDGDRDGEARCDAGSFELSGPTVVEIPTLGEIGYLALVLLLAGAGVLALRR